MSKKKTHEQYLLDLQAKGIDFKVLDRYKNANTKIAHQCTLGHIWEVTPSNVISNNRGCPSCAGNKKHTAETYSQELLNRGIFDYVLEGEFTNTSSLTNHLCLRCNSQWLIRPYDLMQGKGCPSCAKSGFDTTKQALVYFVSYSYENKEYYKIGVTNRTVSERFGPDWRNFKMSLLWSRSVPTGRQALEIESKLLKKYNSYIVNSKAFKAGNTETLLVPISETDVDNLI